MTCDQVEHVSVQLNREKICLQQTNSAFKFFVAFCIAYSLIPVQIGFKSLVKWKLFVPAMHQRSYFGPYLRPCPIDFPRCYAAVTETVADPRYPDGRHQFTPLAATLH